MIKSELRMGKIYSGDTSLASTIRIEQTGAMQLTVRAGSLTTTGDVRRNVASQTFLLSSDRVVNVNSDSVEAKAYRVELGLDSGAVEVLVQARFSADAFQAYPTNWQTVQTLVFEFVLPPNTADIGAIDIYVLTVEKGFPVGTVAADWQVQSG